MIAAIELTCVDQELDFYAERHLSKANARV
jgi:hypothetical protein